tara:strand:+ start:128 stop:463 length:336 start_codon:yes stop_codon:yes gene_type:complete
MKIEVEERDGATVVVIEGDVDMSTAPELRQSLQRLVSDSKSPIFIDLSHVPYIDSSGLATLVECYQGTKRFKGTMVLTGLSETVMEVFRMTHLDKHFSIYQSLEEGVNAVG